MMERACGDMAIQRGPGGSGSSRWRRVAAVSLSGRLIFGDVEGTCGQVVVERSVSWIDEKSRCSVNSVPKGAWRLLHSDQPRPPWRGTVRPLAHWWTVRADSANFVGVTLLRTDLEILGKASSSSNDPDDTNHQRARHNTTRSNWPPAHSFESPPTQND